jgi:cobalt transport protein ATP-binding subunit
MPVKHLQVPAYTEAIDKCSACALGVKRLSFAYPDGHIALNNIDLEISRGEKVALVGPNGAGKSTLMLHLNGIYHGSGEIYIDEDRLSKENLAEIRAKVGLVFQNPDDQLFSPTVYEDVAFGPLHMGFPEEQINQRVDEALAQVGMQSYAQRLSYHLSVGEKKRIAIATVLSMTPSILVLDEPTAGLDPRARRSLIGLLSQLTQTMLVSTHDLLLVRELFPRMVIMDEGQIVADGCTDKILNDQHLLEKHGLELP